MIKKYLTMKSKNTVVLRHVLAIGLLLLAGCSSFIEPNINLHLAVEQPLIAATNHLNSNELTGKTIKVLTVSKPSDHPFFKKYNIDKSLSSQIERTVAQYGAVNVDREIGGQLIDEIMLSEDTSTLGQYDGPEVSDYILVGKLTSGYFSQSFSLGKTLKNKEGEIYQEPSFCSYKVTVDGYVKILSLPDMKQKQTISFKERAYRQEEVGSEQYKTTHQYRSIKDVLLNQRKSIKKTKVTKTANDCHISDDDKAELYRQAIARAFTNSKAGVSLKVAVAAKAYILAKKSDGKTTFFKTTLGKKLGAREGAQVRIYMEDEHTGELLFLSDGKITGQSFITEKSSYIYLLDESLIPLIRKGLVVKLYEECGFNCNNFQSELPSLLHSTISLRYTKNN